MPKIHPSVRQWVLSFLAVDIVFWLLVGWGCVVDSNSCWETFSFAPIILYPLTTFPLIGIPPAESLLGPLGTVPQTIVLVGFGVLTHVLLGALVGWALRKTNVAKFVSFAVALVVLFGGTYAVSYYNFKAEEARESKLPVPTREETVWSSWPEYGDPQGRFSFRAEPSMKPVAAEEPYGQLGNDAALVAYSSDMASYHPMNYSQNSWFVVSAKTAAESECFVIANGGQDTAFLDEQTVGSTTFQIAKLDTAGMGNRYEQTIHRAYSNGTCWEIATTLHYASDFTEIDEAAMNASQSEARTALADMVSTFRFNF